MKIFEKSNLKGDIFGGITAGIVALPLALAFGIQAFGVISVDDVPNIGAIGKTVQNLEKKQRNTWIRVCLFQMNLHVIL